MYNLYEIAINQSCITEYCRKNMLENFWLRFDVVFDTMHS